MIRKKYLNHIIGFNYRGRVYQWDFVNAEFTPNSSIPKDYPKRFSFVPDEAINIRIFVYEYIDDLLKGD